MNRLVILMPVYNDWVPCAELLRRLDGVLAEQLPDAVVQVLLVDDGSIQSSAPAFEASSYRALASVQILRLRRNLGHQRAICTGLVHVHSRMQGDAVVVMDADGEDDPRDVPRLLRAMLDGGGRTIVFAERTKRSEGLAFRLGYAGFRAVHWLLVGDDIKMGNFSVVPRERLDSLVVVAELWNHYAAAVRVSRQPHVRIPTMRAARIAGLSHMNWTSLVVHGLSAIAVYSDRVGVRLLAFSAVTAGTTLIGLILVTAVRAATGALPEWLPLVFVLLLIVFFQASSLAVTFVFAVLGGRERTAFLPLRDTGVYVRACETIWSNPASAEFPTEQMK